MKKYFLTALLGAFACIGFASADTVGNFTSDNDICSFSVSSSSVNIDDIDSECDLPVGGFYMCTSTLDFPFVLYYSDESSPVTTTISSENYCFSSPFAFGDNVFSFDDYDKTINGTFYFSSSAITYSAPGGGSGGGSSSEGILNATGQAYLGNVLSGVQSVVTELIPYMVYLALAILIVTLGFIAIKWLMNYTSRRVTGLFSSRKRK